jgi:hypothetical protein
MNNGIKEYQLIKGRKGEGCVRQGGTLRGWGDSEREEGRERA